MREASASQLGIACVAHGTIVIEAEARFFGGGHCVTDLLGPGDALSHDVCTRF